MSKFEKYLARLRTIPADFRWDELEVVLDGLGYSLRPTSKTGGSRRAFVHINTGHTIFLHKPHPGNIIKRCALKSVIESLEENGVI
jgi:hypothetical protein